MIDYNNIPDEGAASRRCGWIATALYVLVVGLSMWLVRCESRSEMVDNASSGSLEISFGDVTESSGETIKSVKSPATPVTPQPKVEEVSQLTDQRSEVEVPQPKSQQEALPTESQEPVATPDPIEAKPREVNKRALFPGTSSTKSDAGEGESESAPQQGVSGSDRGTPGKRADLGDGLMGDYSLSGRSLIGSLPIPSYTTQAEGRVVIAIMVDDKGRVTSASVQTANSTTNNARLISAAMEAAKKARFSQSDDFFQGGTITYIFKMN